MLLHLLPLLTLASAILTIVASLLGPAYTALLFVFKPLTTVLVIAYAWPRGAAVSRRQRFVRIGLALSLVGDVCLLWPKEGFLPGLVSFLLAHLAYIAAFCVPVRFAARPSVFVAYGVIAALILSQLWPGVPGALRAPVLGYVVCLATMAAQAAVWWRTSANGSDAPFARAAAIGGVLFMASDSLLATTSSRYLCRSRHCGSSRRIGRRSGRSPRRCALRHMPLNNPVKLRDTSSFSGCPFMLTS